jgi:NAD(P)-dependent dehydrogenase (short-subunit alcohol dehydrogenase family)
MSKRLQGRAALVTGAGNGIGKNVALALAAEGASVVVNDLGTDVQGDGTSSAAADGTVAEIEAAGGTAVANYDSIAESAGCKRAVQTAIENFGSCDIVIANAGALLDASSLGLRAGDDSWQRLLNLYLGQKFWLSREAVPGMLERGWGRVLFATSEIGRGTQKNPLGAVAMSGGIGMIRDLGAQHRGSGVTFNAYAPAAATRTYELFKDQIEAGLTASGIPEEELAAHHLPGPEFIAPMITWLCTDAAADVTGEVFSLSGGTIARWSRMEDVSTLVNSQGGAAAKWSLDDLDKLAVKHLFPAVL